MKTPVRLLSGFLRKAAARRFASPIAILLVLVCSGPAFSKDVPINHPYPKNTRQVSEKTSGDASLAALKLSCGVLDPVFSADISTYSVFIDPTVSSVTVTPKTTAPGSAVTVNGNLFTPGDTAIDIPLIAGANVITIIVTAEDRTTTQTYTVNVTRSRAAADDDAVAVNELPEKPTFDDDVLIVHRGVTPNGDGIDDYLVIDGILAYPDNKLTIVNRNGQVIYEAKGYDNSAKVFDGRSSINGQLQQPGTYFFELDYTANGIIRRKTGYLVLKY